MIPHVSVELRVPKANTGNIPVSVKNSSTKINKPAATQRKLKITVIFDGGVQAILNH